MASINTKAPEPKTHEGGSGWAQKTPLEALRRSVLSCFLWENEFYEDGQSIADRISENARKVSARDLANLAIEAREQGKLRHVPLLLLDTLLETGAGSRLPSETIARVIQRPDELTEMLAIYWRNGKRPLSAQLKRGLAAAFMKFDEYQLAKYNRDGAVKLRDVLFLTHAKPKDEAQAALWKRLVDGELATPDTWEVGLSGGGGKKETFERLLREEKLGYLALLRNLRNMEQSKVDRDLVRNAIEARKGAHRVLPFRFVSAARAAPSFEPSLDIAMKAAIADTPALPGRTVVCVDTSASMYAPLSQRSTVLRADAASALGSMINGDVRMIAFASGAIEVPARRGMAGVDAIRSSMGVVGHETNIRAAIDLAETIGYDRLIVITDEQTAGRIPAPKGKKGYMINVASAKNGVGYGPWVHIDGFSENTLKFIREIEGV